MPRAIVLGDKKVQIVIRMLVDVIAKIHMMESIADVYLIDG
jgi:hypothetical protein